MKNMMVTGAYMIVLVLMLGSCSVDSWDGNYDVIYEITATSTSVDINYTNANGNVQMLSGIVTFPWTHEMTAYCGTEDFDYFLAVLSATNKSAGSVTARIYAKKSNEDDFALKDSITSTGLGTTASVSAILEP